MRPHPVCETGILLRGSSSCAVVTHLCLLIRILHSDKAELI